MVILEIRHCIQKGTLKNLGQIICDIFASE